MAESGESEALYRQLAHLLASVPADLYGPSEISADSHRWIARGHVLVERVFGAENARGMIECTAYRSSADHLHGIVQQVNAHRIVAILHRALAVAEQRAPVSAQGAFIPAGGAFDVFHVISQVLGQAKKTALIVDAYMGAKALTDFAPLAPEGVVVQLLADGQHANPGVLLPGIERWAKQYGDARPLELRVTPKRSLHDRLIIIDDTMVWDLSQSLEHFADRAHASVTRVDDPQIAEPKKQAYRDLWNQGTPLR